MSVTLGMPKYLSKLCPTFIITESTLDYSSSPSVKDLPSILTAYPLFSPDPFSWIDLHTLVKMVTWIEAKKILCFNQFNGLSSLGSFLAYRILIPRLFLIICFLTFPEYGVLRYFSS